MRKRTFDAILLLGCELDAQDGPTRELALRAREAAAAYREGLAPVIVASGGVTQGHARAEADVMTALLLDEGVPQEAIVREDRSQDTAENMRFSAALLGGGKRALVVTSDYHLRRAVLTARRAGLRAGGRACAPAHDAAWRERKRKELAYTADLLLGWQDEGKTRPAWTYRLFDLVFSGKRAQARRRKKDAPPY